MESLDRKSSNVQAFEGGSFRERTPGRGIYACMPMCGLKRLAQRYEYGKLKYGKADAYKDGLPVQDSIDSMFRHLVSYLEGDNSEDHMAAIAWGALCVMHVEENVPKFQDVPGRKKFTKAKGDFEYLKKNIEGGFFK